MVSHGNPKRCEMDFATIHSITAVVHKQFDMFSLAQVAPWNCSKGAALQPESFHSAMPDARQGVFDQTALTKETFHLPSRQIAGSDSCVISSRVCLLMSRGSICLNTLVMAPVYSLTGKGYVETKHVSFCA